MLFYLISRCRFGLDFSLYSSPPPSIKDSFMFFLSFPVIMLSDDIQVGLPQDSNFCVY